jgi:hypothetical protein
MRNLSLYKQFIVLLGMFLDTRTPAAAQLPAQQTVLTQRRVAQTPTLLPTVPTPVPAASFLLSQPATESAHFSRLFIGAYKPDHGLECLPQMQQIKNLNFTQSSLPLVQLWSGRLQLEAFQNTLHIQNLRSVHFSGLSLSFHLGRDARTGRPHEALRMLSRILLSPH